MTFKVKDRDKDKRRNMSSRIDDEKLLKKQKTIWIKTEDLKNIQLYALPVCDD